MTVGVVVVVGHWLLSLLVVVAAAAAVALLLIQTHTVILLVVAVADTGTTSSPTPNMMQDPSQLDTLAWDVMGPPPLQNRMPEDRRQAAQAVD